MSRAVELSTSPRPWGRWLRWGLGILLGLLVLVALAIWLGFDPWLRRTLEHKVSEQTHGQYQLQINHLETKFGPRALHLRGLALRPTAATVADTLPRVQLRLARLDLSGVGVLALLRGHTAPVDSLVLDSLQVQVLALAKKPAPHPTAPFYEQHPLQLGYLALRHTGGTLGPADAPTAQVTRAEVQARDLLITSAGAADTQRLAFAAAWQAVLRYPQGRLGGHIIALATATFSSEKQTFSVDSLSIEPPAPGQGTPGATQVAFLMPQLRVRGLQAAAWQHQQRFRADSVVAQQPRLSFRPPAQAPPPLWELIQPLAHRADIRHFRINDGFMAITGLQHKPVVRHVFAVGEALRVDSVGGHAGGRRILYARSWAARSGRITATFDAPAYPASIERVFLNTQTGAMRLTGLALRPIYSPIQLNRRKGYQVTQVRIQMPELRAQGFDFNLLSDHSHLRIARLTAERPWLGLGSDGRGPIDPHQSVMTPEAVRKLRLHLEIARFDIHNATIYTTYRSGRTPRLGTFTISELTGTLRNVSNNPRSQTVAHPLTASATALVEGRSRLQAHLTAPLLDAQGRHHLWGSFGAAPLTILNHITVPTKLLGFKSGNIQLITFDLHANRRQITGTMQARYTDLKFEFFKYKDGELKKPLFTRLKNGLVNVVVRDNNPRPSGRFVTGDMTSRRELQSSVFSAWRQGLISGLLNSAGVPSKMAQKLSQSQSTVPLP
ncbi:MAG: hypothetical protein ACRYFZ_05180 [Janthinobacterium lividum]